MCIHICLYMYMYIYIYQCLSLSLYIYIYTYLSKRHPGAVHRGALQPRRRPQSSDARVRWHRNYICIHIYIYIYMYIYIYGKRKRVTRKADGKLTPLVSSCSVSSPSRRDGPQAPPPPPAPGKRRPSARRASGGATCLARILQEW